MELPASTTLIISYPTVGKSNHRPNNVLLRVDHGSDTDSTDNGGSRRPTSTSGDTSTDAAEAQRGHYRGITFEEILPPQFISNAPPPTAETKRGSVRLPKPSDSHGPPAASSLTSEPPAKRSYPSASKHSDSKPSGGGGQSRIRKTARALVRGLSMAKKRDSRGYGTV